MSKRLGGVIGLFAALGVVGGTALAHELDHAPPTETQAAPLSRAVQAGGEGDIQWELLASFPTGNPQTDLDFFTHDGDTYLSVGSLAAGPNSAGQNIFRLTEKGDVKPSYVTGHPSATCPKATSSATGLQHDAEASPKGDALPQFPNPYIDRRETQLVIDATDATGRCHDQGVVGVQNAPQGGLEIIDVTDPAKPTEIGLTVHVGQAHTVNVDPKRPHIAYVSSSDQVLMDAQGRRTNEYQPCRVSQVPPEDCPPQGRAPVSTAMDGIEVVDISSCLNLPAGLNETEKRALCRPQVYRYRWPDVNMLRSHTYRNSTGACHELEIYPDDRLVCAGLMATAVFDMKGAFDDNGTPTDFTDDKPRGTPLPCRVRPTSTSPPQAWGTGAMVTDCHIGNKKPDGTDQRLEVQPWINELGAPSLEGVGWLGTYHHMGFENQQRENASNKYDSTKDIYVSHEAEFTQSGDYVFASDERGGGVLPVGASCSPGADNVRGNGGIHAFRVDRLSTEMPAEGDQAVAAYQERMYAKDSKGNRAIFRAPVRTEPQGSLCTAHVFQQIPGQNRIFMGWYSQGTQVVDFKENADGTIDFKNSGFFIPANANEWTSHIFKVQENPDGSFTYWGAIGDFALGDAGRNAVEIYKVTMPAPPKPRGSEPAGTPTFPVSDTKGVPVGSPAPPCANASGFNRIGAGTRDRRRRLRLSWTRRSGRPVRVQIFRHSKGRRIARRELADFTRRRRASWSSRRARNGFYAARLTIRAANGGKDVRHVAFRKRNGRLYLRPYFDRRETCDLVKYFTLGRPVFGGKPRRAMRMTFKLRHRASVSMTIKRRNKVVKRIRAKTYRAGKHRVVTNLRRRAKRATYKVEVRARRPGQVTTFTLHTRYL